MTTTARVRCALLIVKRFVNNSILFMHECYNYVIIRTCILRGKCSSPPSSPLPLCDPALHILIFAPTAI